MTPILGPCTGIAVISKTKLVYTPKMWYKFELLYVIISVLTAVLPVLVSTFWFSSQIQYTHLGLDIPMLKMQKNQAVSQTHTRRICVLFQNLDLLRVVVKGKP